MRFEDIEFSNEFVESLSGERNENDPRVREVRACIYSKIEPQ